MSKIFRKSYHEISSSWDFKQLSKKIDSKNVEYNILRDQDNNYLLTFFVATSSTSNSEVNFRYNTQKDEILNHDVDLLNDVRRGFYYKYIEYAYNNITTNDLQKVDLTIFSKKICKQNEYIQNQYQNVSYQIEGFYLFDNNVIKVYFRNLSTEAFNKLVNFMSKIPEKDDGTYFLQNIRFVDDVFMFFTIDELLFIRAIYMEKRSVGLKNPYFSIMKEAFVKLIPYIKNLQEKFSIYETGERLIFAEHPLSLSFYISQIDQNNFSLTLSETHTIHQFFVYFSTYLLINNTIHKTNLPFDDETIKLILDKNFLFKKSELVYYKTVVGRQLSLFYNYLDFEENLEFPQVAEDLPKVYFIFSNSENSNLNIRAFFEYKDGKKIPLTLAIRQHNLFKLSFINSNKWYHLTDELLFSVKDFATKHLFFDPTNINEYEWEVTNQQDVHYIKTNLYDKANQNWIIILSEDLKNEFVKTINLVPEIEVSSDDQIDWFSYKVVYKFQNIEFTQDALRSFFNSGAKYLTAPDGSNIKIGNRDLFDEIEGMIQVSKKDADYFHKMAIYRLPWIYELKKINPAITIYGDKYLDEMYSSLHRRTLKESLQPHYTIKPVMRSYQKVGYEWLKMLEKFKLNGILADEMGLGKTLQAISVLTDLPQDSKSLIICPKTLLFNWVAEIEKFNPQLKYIIYEGTKDIRTNLLKTVPVQIVIASYNLIQNDFDEFNKIYFDYLILDEAQHIKNHITLRAKAIKKIRARHKLAMTGTPLENSILELWSVFDFLMPGYLPPLKKIRDYMFPAQSTDSQNKNIYKEQNAADSTEAADSENAGTSMDKLKQYIAPFILRRKKKDVLIELPDKQEQAIFCTMTEQQEQYYIQVLEAAKNEVFGQDNNLQTNKEVLSIYPLVQKKTNAGSFNYITMLAALTRLRQICDHPGLINDEWLNTPEISGKLNTLNELIQDAIENGRKILVFSQYIKMLKLIEGLVKVMNVPYEYMDGSTKDRKTIINHFNNNEKVRLFLISLKTGGFGINLTSADTVILVDPWWNPMVEHQAIDRVHRMGQTKKVLVYKLITKGSVEEKIMFLQKKKRDLFENVIDQGEAVLKNLDNDDLKMLFEYKS